MNINGLSRIYLKEVVRLINRKDNRSALAWCEKNGVEIYRDSSGKYVIESEFSLAYNKPVIEKYKKKYGDQWQIFYNRSKNGNLHLSLAEEKKMIARNRYQPKSKWSQEILGSIKK